MPLIGQPVQFRDLSDRPNEVIRPATILGILEDGLLELSVQKKSSAGTVTLELVVAPTEAVTTFEPETPAIKKAAKKEEKDEKTV